MVARQAIWYMFTILYSPPDAPQMAALTSMSLRMECHSKRNVNLNEMSLKMVSHFKWNVTRNGTSLKMERH